MEMRLNGDLCCSWPLGIRLHVLPQSEQLSHQSDDAPLTGPSFHVAIGPIKWSCVCESLVSQHTCMHVVPTFAIWCFCFAANCFVAARENGIPIWENGVARAARVRGKEVLLD